MGIYRQNQRQKAEGAKTMTDQQVFQEQLIKSIEGIKSDIAKVDTLEEAQAVVDEYLSKAKRIKEIQNDFN